MTPPANTSANGGGRDGDGDGVVVVAANFLKSCPFIGTGHHLEHIAFIKMNKTS